jgi:hypothetical protein
MPQRLHNLRNVEEGHFNWMLSQHPVSVLKDDGITIILRFEEGNRENWRHGIPEKEVLLAAISWLESMSL